MVDRQDELMTPDGSLSISDLSWSDSDEADLRRAVTALERSSFASRLSGLLGRQIGFIGDMIPEEATRLANAAATKALSYALKAALSTLPAKSRAASSRWHIAAVAASGAVGGALGLATLPIELPVSTALMLRSIAGIAREEGEDVTSPEVSVACLEVFALGVDPGSTPLGQSSYFAAKALMAKSVSEATRYLVQRGIVEESAPVLLRLFGQIASRFGLVVTQKIVAQTVPLVGAAAGAAINAAFMEHYQGLARGHFIVRRLERRYGAKAVREAYERVSTSRSAGAPTLSTLHRDALLSAGAAIPELPTA